jgi:hypothetical protein
VDIAGTWARLVRDLQGGIPPSCRRSGWWVWIEVLDDTSEHLLPGGEPYQGNYPLSIEYVNGLEMMFEQGD